MANKKISNDRVAYPTYIRLPLYRHKVRTIKSYSPTLTVWCAKTRMVWLSDGESLRIRLLVLTESTNVTDGQTNGRTPHDGIGRAFA